MARFYCDMRGYLSFLILWLLAKKPMSGSGLAEEIGRRKGIRPNPGTIYPTLSYLVKLGAISSKARGRQKVYSLTPAGRTALRESRESFCRCFGDVFGS